MSRAERCVTSEPKRPNWRKRLVPLIAALSLAGCSADTNTINSDSRMANPSASRSNDSSPAATSSPLNQEGPSANPLLPKIDMAKVEEITGIKSVEEAVQVIDSLPYYVLSTEAEGVEGANARPLVEAAQGNYGPFAAIKIDLEELSEAYNANMYVFNRMLPIEQRFYEESKDGDVPLYLQLEALKAQHYLLSDIINDIQNGAAVPLKESIDKNECPKNIAESYVIYEVSPGDNDRYSILRPVISKAYFSKEALVCQIDSGDWIVPRDLIETYEIAASQDMAPTKKVWFDATAKSSSGNY